MRKKWLLSTAAVAAAVAISTGCGQTADTGKESSAAIQESTAEIKEAEKVQDETSFTLVKGETKQLKAPEDFQGTITWTSTNNMRNVGSSQKKSPLDEGETDGDRSAGLASADHLLSVDENGLVTAHEKGNGICIIARDETGKEKVWEAEVRAFDESQLPEASAEDFADLRARYVAALVGEDNDLSDPDVKAFVDGIDEAAGTAWDTYEYKGQECAGVPWSAHLKDGDLDSYKNDAVKFRASYQSAEAMAKAYKTPGSQYYGNQELLEDIIKIMDWLSENCYYPRSETDNWWTWEIGLPKNVLPICIYLYDDLTPEQRVSYTAAVRFFQPDPFHAGSIGTASTHAKGYRENTSANLMDCAYTAIGLGLVLEDGEYLSLASQAAATTMTDFQTPIRNEDGTYSYTNGFYEDGSYIDHSVVPYAASYGLEFLKGSVQLVNLLGNTPWTLSQENLDMLETYLTDGYIAAIYEGAALDMLRGRAVCRPTLTDRDAAADIIEVLVKAMDAVSEDTRSQIKSAVKYWLTVDENNPALAVTDVAVLAKIKEILADDSIDTSPMAQPRHKIYPLMDRTVHQMAESLFAVSMFSSRISNCEIMNDENLKGWYTGFGMTYLYNDDLSHYTDNYWNTVNACKLPGTTVVPVEIDNGEPDSSGFHQSGDFLSPEDWVGGTSIGNYGVSGMKLSGKAMSNGDSSNVSETVYADDLKAQKSYFMLDKEIVCLGAGINNSGFEEPTITVVENRKIKDDASNQVTADGQTLDLSSQQTLSSTWIALEGNTEEGSDIAYYFPEKQELHLQKIANTGSWNDIKGDLADEYEPVTKNYFECWFDHGAAPADASYSYVILPDMDAAMAQDYAENHTMEILANTTQVQAVKDPELGVLMANFWADETVTVDGVTCDSQASVMVLREDGQITVSVADPTMLNTGEITLTLELEDASGVISADDNVKVETADGKAVVTVSADGLCGFSSKAVIGTK